MAAMALQEQESDEEETEEPKRKKTRKRGTAHAGSDEEDQGSASDQDSRQSEEHKGIEEIEERGKPSAAHQQQRMFISSCLVLHGCHADLCQLQPNHGRPSRAKQHSGTHLKRTAMLKWKLPPSLRKSQMGSMNMSAASQTHSVSTYFGIDSRL